MYVSQLGLGAGSYNFEPSGESYIDYSKAPKSWAFDNNEKFPPKQPFLNPQFDIEKRTFSG